MPDADTARLFHPFERGLLDLPGEGEHWLILGAQAGFSTPPDFRARLSFVQDFRPHFLALERAGFAVAAEADGEGYDGALVMLGRNRRENEIRLFDALDRVRPGGAIVAAGGRTDGAASLRKRVADLLPLDGHAAKHHGEVFWLLRPETISEEMREALAPREPVRTEEGFFSAEGGFSADGVDPGSLLLAQDLPNDLTGEVADFASGWGYLATCALRRSPGIDRIDLYEAHRPSLLAAKRNLSSMSDGVECRFFWHDLLREPVTARYDAILMNPPFHQGRAAEPDLGVEMIGTAAKALKRGGRLFMVANRPLPYERVLEKLLPRYEEICRHARFKVLVGRK